MSDHSLLTEAEIDHMERRCAALVEDGRWDHQWTTHSIMCALATIRDRDARLADAAAQIEALRAEVERGREVLGVAREAIAPLAVIAEEYAPEEEGDYQVWRDFDVLGASLQLKRFRRAAAALAKINALTGES